MDFRLSEDEQLIQDAAKGLAERYFAPDAFSWDGKREYPWEYGRRLAEHGFSGMLLPPEDGGHGRSMMEAVLVMETLSSISPRAADVFQVMNTGALMQLARFGPPELKARVVPFILDGSKLIVTGMTESDNGSDTTNIKTRARVEGDTVILNGGKIFNTHGDYASHWVVWCKFGPSTDDIGLVLVERDSLGFHISPARLFVSGDYYVDLGFSECRVPLANVILPNQGFKKMINTFNFERMGNASRSLGQAQLAFNLAVAYAKERNQFGRPLCEFQGLQWKFAEMKMKLEAARLLIYRTAANAAHEPGGTPRSEEVSLAKCFANQTAFDIANEALQIFGGSGYTVEAPINYLFRRTRGWMIAGGSIEIQKNNIAAHIFGRRFKQRAPKAS